jgi:hypothetical protein
MTDRKPNPMQQHSIDLIRRHLESNCKEHMADYGAMISKFNVEPTDYNRDFWVSAEVELANLGEGNLLRALCHEWWFLHIGPRGKITAHSYPQSYEQFKGKRNGFGINFK